MDNVNGNYSAGTQVNRYLDSLGLNDKFGDQIGALIDLQRGDLAGAARNLIDLQSGLSTKQFDRLTNGRPNPAFGRGHVGRHQCNGNHLRNRLNGYFNKEQVGKQAHVGQRFNYGFGPFQFEGRITGNQYRGSFGKPVQLSENQWLYRGRSYDSLQSIIRDASDGRTDGLANRRPNLNQLFDVFKPQLPNFNFPGGGDPGFNQNGHGLLPGLPNFPFPGNIAGGGVPGIGQGLQDIIGKLLEGIANGPRPSAPSNGAGSANGSTGVDDEADKILSGNGSLEDKLLALMSKLSKHLDEQIENQMKKIEKEMAKQKEGGANGANGASPAQGAAGGGGADGAGQGAGGAQGGGDSSGTDKSNLQLLQTQLQQMVDRRNQMFQTMSQMLKSLGETSMAAIRNLKA